MNLKERQAAFNDVTRDYWQSYASHRQKVTELILAAATHSPTNQQQRTLCILGAGNGNDLDLESLAGQFDAIHLFDFDETASQHIRNRYQDQAATLERLHFEPPVDVTGVQQQLEQFAAEPSDSAAKALADLTQNPQWPQEDQQYDVVVSCCLLTQLIAGVLYTVGGDSPHYLPTVLAIRAGHLRLMERLLKTDGRGLLITDFVSSDTLPALSNADDDAAVLAISRMAIDQRNFFTGGNPFAVKQNLESILRANLPANQLPAIDIAPPWRWQLGSRFYLVTALSFSTRPLECTNAD